VVIKVRDFCKKLVKYMRVGRYGEEERCIQVFFFRKPEEKKPLGKPRRSWRVILKRIFKNWDGDMDWIDFNEDRDSGLL
jgi:hypothetical protein